MMQPNQSKLRRLWVTGVAVVSAGAAWFFMNGNPWAAIPSRSTTIPAMPAPVTASAPLAKPEEMDVTVPAESIDRLHLKFAKITEATVKVQVRVPGTVQPNAYQQVHVVPIGGGVVTQVSAEFGYAVKRGQILAQVFSRDLAEAQTAYLTFNAELEVEHKKLLRTQELVRLGAASRQELEEVEGNHQVHAAHVEEARQRLLLLGLDQRQITEVGAGRQASPNLPVLSPLDGVVTARSVNPGQVVTSGQALFTVTDLSSVWIEANLLENDFGAVHIGSQAAITTPAYPTRQYRGPVEYIDPQVDPQTRTAKVRVAVDNSGLALRLGMYMDIVFTTSGEKVMVVPKQAIQSVASASVVYIPNTDEAGRFIQRIITTGEETEAGLQVLDGLKPGDTVVTDGSFLLRAEALRQHRQ